MGKRAPFGPALLTAARLRCPNCRQAGIFRGWPNRVWRNCPVCGLSLIRESGYYIGGMIVTYVITTLVLLATFLLSLLLPFRSGLSDNYLLWTAFAILLVLLFVRPAYSLWLAADYWIAPWRPGEESSSHRPGQAAANR